MSEIEREEVLEEDDNYDVDLSDLQLDGETDEPDSSQTGDEGAQEDADEKQEEAGQPPAQEEPDPAAEKEEPEKEELFDLKYNKEIRHVNRQEMTELAQKGLNHDRILAQRDDLQRENETLQKFKQENETDLELLHSSAELAGMTVNQFLNSIRENALVAKGMSRDAAKERIKREDAEKRLAKKDAEAAQKAKAADEETSRKNRIRQDSEAFAKKYKDVDPKSIPQEVWDAVASGESLVSAYGNYQAKQTERENEKLRAEIAALKKNKENREKSIGSMKTDGQQKGKDPFLEGLFGDD